MSVVDFKRVMRRTVGWLALLAVVVLMGGSVGWSIDVGFVVGALALLLAIVVASLGVACIYAWLEFLRWAFSE